MDVDDMDEWRRQESQELGELVQKRLQYIQVRFYGFCVEFYKFI